ncbi:MAG TPA: hypothetical protein VHQ22_09520, partial [Terriglobales bacterium]|nr:hypothetical protein [Terriglobales bacterium]
WAHNPKVGGSNPPPATIKYFPSITSAKPATIRIYTTEASLRGRSYRPKRSDKTAVTFAACGGSYMYDPRRNARNVIDD